MNMNCACYIFCLAAGLLACASSVSAQRIRGVPGVDYPNLKSIPKTSFKCSDQKHVPGFYADTETGCQVFHFCYKRRSESFLCPAGTIFNQAILACDSWFNSNCSLATMYYIVNASPGMKNAGKNIPMLRKLRDRVKSSTVPIEHPTTSTSTTTTTTTTTTMAPETEAPEEIFEHFPAEEFGHETEGDYSRDDEAVASQETDYEHPNQFDSDQVVEEEAQSFYEETSTYDPVTEDIRMRPFDSDQDAAKLHPEPVYRNPAAQEFQDEYDAEQMQANQRAQFLQQMVAATTLPPFIQETTTQAALNNAESFTKRRMQFSAGRRNRRKPTYVVMDQTPVYEHAIVYEPTTEVPVSTEGPITEEISMDTLVELNTQLPVDYTVIKDESGYEAQEMEEVEPQVSYQDSSPEMDEEPAMGYDEPDSYDAEGQEATEEYVTDGYTTDGYTTEYLEPTEEISSESYEEQGAETEPEEELQDEADDDVVVYDDSSSLQPPKMVPVTTPRAGQKEKVIVIPDETEFPSTKVTGRGASGAMDGETEDREDIYIVDDSVEGRPGYRYQVIQDSARPAFYDPRAQPGFRQYGGPRVIPGRSYGYRVPPGGMNYGRMQRPGYNYGRYQRYPPKYYEYVDEYGRPLNPQHVDPTIQHLPEDPDQFDEPDGMYEHGVYGDSYEEGMQGEDQPEEEEGQYVYNPDTGYYHTPDGRAYTAEGVEVKLPVTPASTGPAESDKQAGEGLQQQEEYPEQPPEGQFGQIPDGTSAGDAQESNSVITDSMGSSSGDPSLAEQDIAEEETYDVTESGLLTESEGQPKDGFIVLDEEGEAGATGDSEDFPDDESLDFDDAAYDEEPAEEVVAEDMVSSDNQSDYARAGEGAQDADVFGDQPEDLPEPEVPDFQEPEQQEPEKSGEPAQEAEPSWPEPSADSDSEPAPPAEETPGSSGVQDAVPPAPEPVAEPLSSAGFQQSPAVNPFAGPGGFMAPSENQFTNMGFQSPMDFGPYGLGPNVRQQFGMMDSSGRPSGGKRGRPGRNPFSFQDKMKNAKQGKFGMFKKMMMQNI